MASHEITFRSFPREGSHWIRAVDGHVVTRGGIPSPGVGVLLGTLDQPLENYGPHDLGGIAASREQAAPITTSAGFVPRLVPGDVYRGQKRVGELPLVRRTIDVVLPESPAATHGAHEPHRGQPMLLDRKDYPLWPLHRARYQVLEAVRDALSALEDGEEIEQWSIVPPGATNRGDDRVGSTAGAYGSRTRGNAVTGPASSAAVAGVRSSPTGSS